MTCFHATRRLPDRPSLASCETSSFSRAQRLLRSSCVRASFWSLSGPSALPGFLPSSRHPRSRPLGAKEHLPSLSSAHRLSQPHDGLRRLQLCGLIPSRCHVQGSYRSGVSPGPQPPRLIAASFLRGVATSWLADGPKTTDSTARPLAFEALIREPMRSSGLVFSRPFGRSPLRVLSSSRDPPTHRVPDSSGHPLMTLLDGVLLRTEARGLVPRRSPTTCCR